VAFARYPSHHFLELMEEAHGSVPDPLIDPWNRIVHVDPFDPELRRPVTDEEMRLIEVEMMRRIDAARKAHSPTVARLLRNLVIFTLIPVFGWRRSEVARLLLADLSGDPHRPEWGAFGGIYVRGKKHCGQPRPRALVLAPADAEASLRRLAWFVDEVRPELVGQPELAANRIWTPDGSYPLDGEVWSLTPGTLFPSSRRTSRELTPQLRELACNGHLPVDPIGLARDFADVREAAGVRPSAGLHCLRHRCAMKIWIQTHDLLEVRAALRHVHPTTTDIYLAGMDKEIRSTEVRRAMASFAASSELDVLGHDYPDR
jgi:integrase